VSTELPVNEPEDEPEDEPDDDELELVLPGEAGARAAVWVSTDPPVLVWYENSSTSADRVETNQRVRRRTAGPPQRDVRSR